jgi:hypothetical protein
MYNIGRMAGLPKIEARMKTLGNYIETHGNEAQQGRAAVVLAVLSQAAYELHDFITGERDESQHGHHPRRTLRKTTLSNLRKLRTMANEIEQLNT